MSRAFYKVFYDARCQICQRSRQMIQRIGPSTPVRFIDVNNPRELSGYPELRFADTRGQMHVIDPAGQLTGGFDAIVALMPILPPLDLLAPLFRWAPIRRLGARFYKWLTANRYRLGGQVSCHDGACQLNL